MYVLVLHSRVYGARSHLATTALDRLRLRPASFEFPDRASFASRWSDVHDRPLICIGLRTAREARARGLEQRSSSPPWPSGGYATCQFCADLPKTVYVHKQQRNTDGRTDRQTDKFCFIYRRCVFGC